MVFLGRDGDSPEHVIDYRGSVLPDAQASSTNPMTNDDYAYG